MIGLDFDCVFYADRFGVLINCFWRLRHFSIFVGSERNPCVLEDTVLDGLQFVKVIIVS